MSQHLKYLLDMWYHIPVGVFLRSWISLLNHHVYMSCRNEPAYISMLAPFLQYLYCEPQRQPQYALLRQSLLRVLLPLRPGAASVHREKDEEQTSPVSESLLHCLFHLVPYMQVKH